jgi:hypothetical protein
MWSGPMNDRQPDRYRCPECPLLYEQPEILALHQRIAAEKR